MSGTWEKGAGERDLVCADTGFDDAFFAFQPEDDRFGDFLGLVSNLLKAVANGQLKRDWYCGWPNRPVMQFVTQPLKSLFEESPAFAALENRLGRLAVSFEQSDDTETHEAVNEIAGFFERFTSGPRVGVFE